MKMHIHTNPKAKPVTLNDQQRALLTLLGAAGIEGVTVDGLLIAVRSAGFEDITRDDVTGKDGLQFLARHSIASLAAGRWYITRKGKESLAK